MLLLLAEDEPAMAEAVVEFLRYHQYAVEWVSNGSEALSRAQEAAFDGCILDIMMPGMDGMTVVKKLREAGSRTPVLLLTAKGELEDKVAGFEAGADDYLPKPFALPELLVRVRAMLRRGESYRADALTFAGVTLEAGRCVLSNGSKNSTLSHKEYQLMELLMHNPGVFFSAETLLDRIWGMDAQVGQGTVWSHISYLRKKLEDLGATATIHSRRGVGYALVKTS